MLALINRNTIDSEGYALNLGESYFPFLQPHRDFVEADTRSLPAVARNLTLDQNFSFALSRSSVHFANSFLGPECVIDYIELLTSRYYEWATAGCPNVFDYISFPGV